MDGLAPDSLLDSYDRAGPRRRREHLNSSRSTDFITPKSEISRIFRDAVLDLSERYDFARPLVNSGRLSVPCTYDGSPLNGPDARRRPVPHRPGSPCVDAPLPAAGFLTDKLGTGSSCSPSTRKCRTALEEAASPSKGLRLRRRMIRPAISSSAISATRNPPST
jgi:hypothetical protein